MGSHHAVRLEASPPKCSQSVESPKRMDTGFGATSFYSHLFEERMAALSLRSRRSLLGGGAFAIHSVSRTRRTSRGVSKSASLRNSVGRVAVSGTDAVNAAFVVACAQIGPRLCFGERSIRDAPGRTDTCRRCKEHHPVRLRASLGETNCPLLARNSLSCSSAGPPTNETDPFSAQALRDAPRYAPAR
jgi:hypothetical protein